MKIVLPKDEVITALQADIKLLKAENSALKRKLTLLSGHERAVKDSKKAMANKFRRIGEFSSRLKELVKDFDDLHGAIDEASANGYA